MEKELPNVQNYHKHTDDTNPFITDSAITYEMLAKKTIENGGGILSSVAHAYQGRYHYTWQIAKKYGLKFIFGTEAYWVKDRKENDKTNSHIILLAKNKEGMKDINEVLSIANEDGYYYKPRIDLDLLFNKLNKDNVFISSSCFTNNMRVQTNKGYKKITEVDIGNKVITHLGNWKTVLNKTKRFYKGDLYKIKAEGNLKEIECTKDHKFPTIQKKHCGVTNQIVWKKAEDMTTKDRLLCPIDERIKDIEVLDFSKQLYELRNKNIRKRKKIKSDIIKVDNQFLEILGIFSAEGSFLYKGGGIKFTLNKEDTMIINKVNQYMKNIFGISPYIKIKKDSGAIDYEFSSTEIYTVFNNLSNSGAKNKNVPSFIKLLPPNKQMQYIKGLFNGDGHIHKKDPRVVFATISKDLAYEVVNILERNKIKSSAYFKKDYVDKNGSKHQASYYIDIFSEAFKNYWEYYRTKDTNYNFNWNENIKKPSRQTILIDGVEYIHKKITKINKENYKGWVYCLNIEDDHSFKVEQIATHNCIAGWKYDDIEEIWLKLFNHFGDNFMLEIQYHNTEIQKKTNKRILNLHKKYGIQMIVGLDTHVLDENGVQDRNDLLLSKKIKYHEEESDWYLDYPTNEIIFKRFLEQGVFNENEIIQAMDNTNILLDFEDIEFDKSMKLPTIYPHKTQEEKNQLMKDILNKEFVNFIKKNNINKEDRKKYIEEIKKEADVILNTNMADYFLLNYEIIKRGKELGGVITPSGRGCFEGQSLILTDNGLKKLKNVKVGNKVLTKDGKFEKVLETFFYDVEEDLYEIIPKYYREGNIFNNKCTSDHKILVKTDDNNIVFKQAKDILLSDKVVVPKIKCNNININNYDIPHIKRNDLFKNDYLFNMFIGIIYRNSEIKDSVISMKLNEKPFEKIKSLIKYFNGTYEIYKNYIQVEIKNTELINFLYDTLQYKKDNEIKNVNFDYLLSLNKEQLSGLLAGLLNGNKNAITRFRNIANLVKIVGLMLDKYYNIGFEKFPYIHKSTGTTLKSRIEYIINLHQVEYDDNNFYLDIEKIKVHKNMNTRVYDIKVENEPSYTIHNMVVHNSSGGFLLNTLFGFSSMDRLKSPIKLFPERFLTEDRVKAGSLVDIDFNVSNPKPFIQAQKEVLGECHSYPMVAYGTIKAKSGFKMYARSQNLDFDIANEISTQIDKYEKAYIYASDEEKEELSIYDFIEEQYHHYIDKSKHYLGIMMDKKIAPCSHILYSQDDVRREIGVMRLTNRTTKEDVMVACIEGAIADKFGYLKNDVLNVTVLDIIAKTYEKIGIPIHTTTELTKLTDNNQKVWDIYEKGLTVGVNQCEKLATTQKAMKYKPKNISELSGFIASIRPGFKSMYSTFESRKPFSYGIKAFDDLIQTEQMPNSFILYQEQLMQTFNFAGFPITECYDIIKAVAKKKPDVLIKLKSEFKKGFAKKIKEVQNDLTEEQIESYCDKVWKIAEDSSRYSFNASHSLAYAYDSLYCAYLKSHYPFEFYSTMLEIQSQKGKKDKVQEIIVEMQKGFGINLGKYEYGADNRNFTIDKENNVINPNLQSLKSIGKNTPNELYSIPKNLNDFIDILVYIKENTKIKKNEIFILINIGYFHKFGGIKKLLKITELFFDKYSKTNSQKTKDKKIEEYKQLFYTSANYDLTDTEKIINDLKYIGDTSRKIPNLKNTYIVSKMELSYSKYSLELLEVSTNKIIKTYIEEKELMNNQFILFSILKDIELYKTRYGNIRLEKYSIIERD